MISDKHHREQCRNANFITLRLLEVTKISEKLKILNFLGILQRETCNKNN